MIAKRGMGNVAVLSVIIPFLLLLCLPAAPAAGAIYYVSTKGDDTNAGTSPKLAWRTISHAARKAKAGDLVRIKAGNYGHENVVVANSGTAEAPIRFEGYDGAVRLEGKDLKWVKGQVRLRGAGVMIKQKAHIKLSGITTLKFRDGIVLSKCEHVTVERCTAGMSGWAGIVLWSCHNCEVRHCTAYNADMCNIGVGGGHDNTIADCWSYCDPCVSRAMPGTGTDYCYSLMTANNVLVTRCRGDGRLHAGHGICFNAGGGHTVGCKNCRVTDSEMYNCWELLGARHGSSNITFVNCYGDKAGGNRYYDHGFYFRTGAHDIMVKNCRVRGLMHGLHAEDSGGRWRKDCGVTRNITFENCIATQCTCGIRLEAPNSRAINCLSARNKCGVEICGLNLKGLSMKKGGLSLKGCIVCQNDVGVRARIPTTEIVTGCNVWGNGADYARQAKPGADCISKDPQFRSATASKEGRGKRDCGDWQLKDTSPCRDMGPYAADPKAAIGMR